MTSQLFSNYWTQWVADTQALMGCLPSLLQQSSPPQASGQLALIAERWLLEIKVSCALLSPCSLHCLQVGP